jgi:hypothetical protein
MRALPEVEALVQAGVAVGLDPSPITGRQTQRYQLLSGRRPECFGLFDTLALRGGRVEEELSGREESPKLFPDLLSAAGWTVQQREATLAELANCVRTWGQSAPPRASCLFVTCAAGEGGLDGSQLIDLAEALRVAGSATGEAGLLSLLSDTQHAEVKRFVNLNNFLAEMGVLERKQHDGPLDWPNSLAYHMGNGQLWVNLQGRDPQGVVGRPDEYEEVRDALVRALPVKVRDPQTGEAAIERVYRKEELYGGAYLFCAPDLVVLFQPGYAPSPRSLRLEFDEGIFTSPPAGTTATAGVHPGSVTGFLLACAPAFAGGTAPTEHVPLTSVAPTLLHALGVPSAGMDSVAVSELFSPSYLQSHPILARDRGRELTDDEEELVIGRLRDLGYI